MNNDYPCMLELFRDDVARIIAALTVVMYGNLEGSFSFKLWHQLRTEVIRQLSMHDQGV